MAIIYTYPKKDSPVLGDLVVISDSQEQNKTKQSSLSGIKTLIDTTYDFYPQGNATEGFWNLEDNLTGVIKTVKMVGTGDATVSFDSLNNQIVVDSTHIDPVYDLLAPAGSPAKIRLTGPSGNDDVELVSTNANLIINRVSDTEIQFTAAGGGGGGSPSYLGWLLEDAAANSFLVETGEVTKFLGSGGITVTAADTAGFDPYTVTIEGTTYTLGATANVSNADVTLTGSDGSASTLTFVAGTNIDDISVAGSNVTINAATQAGGDCTWTVSGDTGDCLVDCGDTLDIISGAGISTEASCSPLQLEITNTADVFKTVQADSGSDSVASGLSSTLGITGGTGVTTVNSGTGTITINADWNTRVSYAGLELGAVGASSFAPSVSLCEYIQIGQYVMMEFYLQWGTAELPIVFNGDTYIKNLPIEAANSASLAGIHGSCQVTQNDNLGSSSARPGPTQGTVGLPTLFDVQLRELNTSHIFSNYNFTVNKDSEAGSYTLAGTIIYLSNETPA